MDPFWDREDDWNRPPMPMEPKQDRRIEGFAAGPNRRDELGPVRRPNGDDAHACAGDNRPAVPQAHVLDPADDTLAAPPAGGVPAWFTWLLDRTSHADL